METNRAVFECIKPSYRGFIGPSQRGIVLQLGQRETVVNAHEINWFRNRPEMFQEIRLNEDGKIPAAAGDGTYYDRIDQGKTKSFAAPENLSKAANRPVSDERRDDLIQSVTGVEDNRVDAPHISPQMFNQKAKEAAAKERQTASAEVATEEPTDYEALKQMQEESAKEQDALPPDQVRCEKCGVVMHNKGIGRHMKKHSDEDVEASQSEASQSEKGPDEKVDQEDKE